MLKQGTANTGIKLIGVAIVTVYAGYWWLCAPVLAKIELRTWWAIGLVCAVAIGAIGSRIAGKWHYVSMAIAIGLIISAAYAEAHMADYEMGMIESLSMGIINEAWVFLIPGIIAAFAGAGLAHIGLILKNANRESNS